MFSLVKGRLRQPKAAYKYLKGIYKDDGAKPSSTRGSSHKLWFGRVTLDIRKRSSTGRVMQHWDRSPRSGVGPSFPGIYKVWLNKGIAGMVQCQ